MQRTILSLQKAGRQVRINGRGLIITAAGTGLASCAILNQDALSATTSSQKEVIRAVANSFAEKVLARADEVKLSMIEASEAFRATQMLFRCLVAGLQQQPLPATWPVTWIATWHAQVAAAVADLAANADRRQGIVTAGNGQVVQWLLTAIGDGRSMEEENIGEGRNIGGGNISKFIALQKEAARALAHLLGDEATRGAVLGHEGALMHLLRFAQSQELSHTPEDAEVCARTLLDTIMDMVASPMPSVDLCQDASLMDVMAAVKVLQASSSLLEGGSSHIAGKTNEATTRTPVSPEHRLLGTLQTSAEIGIGMGMGRGSGKTLKGGPGPKRKINKRQYYGLWDDLPGNTVAVLLAAWALAGWSQASEQNQTKIAEVDSEGEALAEGSRAPERSVRWHMATAVTSLLPGLAKTDSHTVDDLGKACASPLLDAAREAMGKGWEQQDKSLACHSLSALAACVEHSKEARNWLRYHGISGLREIAVKHENEQEVQLAITRVLAALLKDGGTILPPEEARRWSGLLIHWTCGFQTPQDTRKVGSQLLDHILRGGSVVDDMVAKALLATLLTVLLPKPGETPHGLPPRYRPLQDQIVQQAAMAGAQLARVVAQEAAISGAHGGQEKITDRGNGQQGGDNLVTVKDKSRSKLSPGEIVTKAVKALAKVVAEDPKRQEHIINAGGLSLVRRILLGGESECWAPEGPAKRHALRLLALLSAHRSGGTVIAGDLEWKLWLEKCARGELNNVTDKKSRSYANACLAHINGGTDFGGTDSGRVSPRYEDGVFLMAPSSPSTGEPVMDVVFLHGLCGGPFKTWRVAPPGVEVKDEGGGEEGTCWPMDWLTADLPGARLLSIKYKGGLVGIWLQTNMSEWKGATLPLLDMSTMLLTKLCAAGVGQRPVVFVCHSDGKVKILPSHWLSPDGNRTYVHEEKLIKDMKKNIDAKNDRQCSVYFSFFSNKVKVFYSVPHFGSRLADMPWRMGLVLRPAPTVEDLRSVSPRLDELNNVVKRLHQKGQLAILSFSESLLSPVVQTFGGLAIKMEVVPLESAYPGFGDIVLLESSDHVNACKPQNRSDIIYGRTLQLLQNVQTTILNNP